MCVCVHICGRYFHFTKYVVLIKRSFTTREGKGESEQKEKSNPFTILYICSDINTVENKKGYQKPAQVKNFINNLA
jgi:hypothetical protein